MIEEGMIFEKDSLNFFTDASIQKELDGSITSCSGCIGYYGTDTNPIYKNTEVLFNSTNNQAEIFAIYMAITGIIHLLYERKINVSHINIFSDSLISVNGLRNWITGWIKNSKNNELYSSSGQLVANQSIFLECIYMILRYDLKINIYHVHGHKSQNNTEEVQLFKHDFEKLNNLGGNSISITLAKRLIKENDIIDNLTRSTLNIGSWSGYGIDLSDCLMEPIYTQRILDIEKYLKLIEPRKYN